MPASRKARFCEYGPNGSQARCRDDSRFELHLAPHLPHPQFPEAHAQPRDFPILAALRRQFVDDELRRIMNLCGADDVQHWMQLNNRAAFCVATKGDVLDPVIERVSLSGELSIALLVSTQTAPTAA